MKPMEGVTFGTWHTFNDLGLILDKYPDIPTAPIKTNYIEIPCADGVLDVTESLTGTVCYDSREIVFELFTIETYAEWDSVITDIRRLLHGKKMRIILDNDPAFFYYGRVSVSGITAENKGAAYIKITVDADPFKYEIASSTEDWLWDPFSFLTGVIREYKDLVVDGELTITVTGSASTVVPTITCSAPMTVTYNGNVYILSEGDNVLYELSIPDGQHTLVFEGNGTVSIDYRGGVL